MNTTDFVKTVNKLRLDNKGKWYYWVGEVEGKSVKIKGFGTWLQIFKVNNWDCSNCMDSKVRDYKEHLSNAVRDAPKNKYIKQD